MPQMFNRIRNLLRFFKTYGHGINQLLPQT